MATKRLWHDKIERTNGHIVVLFIGSGFKFKIDIHFKPCIRLHLDAFYKPTHKMQHIHDEIKTKTNEHCIEWCVAADRVKRHTRARTHEHTNTHTKTKTLYKMNKNQENMKNLDESIAEKRTHSLHQNEEVKIHKFIGFTAAVRHLCMCNAASTAFEVFISFDSMTML